MKPRTGALINHAVREGVKKGWNSAHHGIEVPEPPDIMQSIHQKVYEEICQWFDFDLDNHMNVRLVVDDEAE